MTGPRQARSLWSEVRPLGTVSGRGKDRRRCRVERGRKRSTDPLPRSCGGGDGKAAHRNENPALQTGLGTTTGDRAHEAERRGIGCCRRTDRRGSDAKTPESEAAMVGLDSLHSGS